MKKVFCVLCFICVSIISTAMAEDIESLRLRVQPSNTKLTSSDEKIISRFWSSSLDQMLLSGTSGECVEVRKELATQKGNEPLSHFSSSYVANAKSAITAAFSDVARMDSPEHRQMIERNLMILVAELKSPALAPLALKHLADEDAVIRYWAYKSLTETDVIGQLTSEITADEKTTEAILSAFKKQAPLESQTENQKMIIRFCRSFDNSLARDVLVSMTDRRIKAYRNWTVRDEKLDATLLSALGYVATAQQGPAKKVFGRKFAELYSLVMQRYFKGKDIFSKTSNQRLRSVIAEVDQNTLGKTMGIQTSILQSLKRNSGLEKDYEVLFGDRVREGTLAGKFKFDYGKDASGKPITAPQELDPAPEDFKE